MIKAQLGSSLRQEEHGIAGLLETEHGAHVSIKGAEVDNRAIALGMVEHHLEDSIDNLVAFGVEGDFALGELLDGGVLDFDVEARGKRHDVEHLFQRGE